jgi:hypothetical protein
VTLIDKVDGLLAGITRNDIERMAPAYRRRLAQALRRIADIADMPPKSDPPKSGILGSLHDGERSG